MTDTNFQNIEKNQISLAVRFEDLTGPTFKIDKMNIAVLECSRRYLRFIGENRLHLKPGTDVTGELHYQNGRIIPLFGELVSHGADQSYFKLKTPVSNAALNRRAHFRICYAADDVLPLVIGKNTVLVQDISEQGMKFSCDRESEYKRNDDILGQLQFHDESHYTIIGKILKRNENICTVRLARSIPYQHIMSEQSYLIRKYPRVNSRPT
jgi:hypothetical protein